MFVLIFQHDTGDLDFHGPFPSVARAEDYARAANRDYGKVLKYIIKPMIVPYFAIIRWRV